MEEQRVQLEEQEQGVSVEGRCTSPNSVPQRSHNLMWVMQHSKSEEVHTTRAEGITKGRRSGVGGGGRSGVGGHLARVASERRASAIRGGSSCHVRILSRRESCDMAGIIMCIPDGRAMKMKERWQLQCGPGDGSYGVERKRVLS